MHRHAGLGFFVLAAAMNVALAAPPEPRQVPPRIAGEWVGELDGELVLWRFGNEGEAHLNGRHALFCVAHDTLRVTFEAPLRATEVRPEVAVYRFLASDPSQGPSRLFVYGFDLGKRGVWLEPAPEEPPLPEDTAPPSPEAKPDTAPRAAPNAASSSPAAVPGNGKTAASPPRP